MKSISNAQFLQTLRMQDSQTITKSFLYLTFTVEIIAWELAITLVILLGAQGYSGFSESAPITATCTAAYFTSKYSSIAAMMQTAFISSIIGMVALTFSFVVLLVWVVRVCKVGNATASVSRCTKIGLYLVSNLAVLATVPACGHYLTHIVELNNCTATYRPAQIIAIFVVALLLLVFALTYLFLILVALCRGSADDQIYRDVQSYPTEQQETYLKPNERNNYYKHSSPSRQAGSRGQNAEHTKENLFEQQERTPNIVYSYKERDPQQPQFQTSKKSNQESDFPSKYMAPESSHYISPQKKASGDNSRLNRRIEEEDFQVERSRYMNKLPGGSILPSKGLEEKSYVRKHHDSPPRRLDRQGMILDHIRGKYAN